MCMSYLGLALEIIIIIIDKVNKADNELNKKRSTNFFFLTH